MYKIYSKFYEIKQNPYSILREKTLQDLYVFWHSCWVTAQNVSSSKGYQTINVNNEFEAYVESYYDWSAWGMSMGWVGLINHRAKDDDEAFKIFFELFDNYLLKTQNKSLEELANRVKENSIVFYYEILLGLKKRPGMYLFQKKFSRLWEFCYGYEIGAEQFFPEIAIFHNQLQMHIEEHFKLINNTKMWDHIISEHTQSEDEAFEVFFQLLDETLLENTGKDLKENAKKS